MQRRSAMLIGVVIVLISANPVLQAGRSNAADRAPGTFAFTSAATQLPTGKVIQATNCSRGAVQAAVDSANDGDTVSVPAGNCT
jgi:hypothetical protein